jgi:hypothetical protein
MLGVLDIYIGLIARVVRGIRAATTVNKPRPLIVHLYWKHLRRCSYQHPRGAA